MGLLNNRNLKVIDKPIEERTVPEIIASVEHVNPMNKKHIIENWEDNVHARKYPKFNKGQLTHGDSYWMNPHNQCSFNSTHLTHQDFIDWANGTGIAIRGKTQEQKDKFMRGDKADRELDLGLQIYIDKLWCIDSESPVKLKKWDAYPKYRRRQYSKPINMSNRRDSHDVIKEVFSQMVQGLYQEIKDRWEWDGRYCANDSQHDQDWLRKIKYNHREYMLGVTHMLSVGGHGYFEACNTPRELENLSWSKDLIFAKAYSIFAEEQDPGIIECMQWCYKNRNTKF